MRRDLVDFHFVPDSQLEIHRRLEAWASWVRVRPHGWQVAPMFRQYRPYAHPRSPGETQDIRDAVEIEKAVSLLPERQREAIRWHYVWSGPPGAMARRLGVSKEGLAELVMVGRVMLLNRGA